MISRREFLKLAAVGASSLVVNPWRQYLSLDTIKSLPDFPQSERLGRVCRGKLEVKTRPDVNSQTVSVLYEDAIVPWLREVIGDTPTYIFNNQRWVEIPDGFVYGALFQPVQNRPNTPVNSLAESSLGPGMWVEVTIPYVDVILENKPSSNSWVSARVDEGMPVRFYYSQVFWVDRIRTDEQGNILYRVNPNYYGGVDMLWAPAQAFRPITPDEITPLSPDVEDKRVVIDVIHQVLSCYEGSSEVFFCRVSTGAKYDMYGNPVDKWSTPLGKHLVSRKYISLQMSGGTTGAGYDLPGIGWTSIFATGGVAIHSTFWHNNYGDTMSHGCVNVSPEDAKWIFRWTMPTVPYDNGATDITVAGAQSTVVEVKEG